jgi:hypothetical protein
MTKLSRNSLDKFNKSCSTFHRSLAKLGLQFSGFCTISYRIYKFQPKSNTIADAVLQESPWRFWFLVDTPSVCGSGELAHVRDRERAGRESPPPKGSIPGLGRVRKRAGEWACWRPAAVAARSSASASSRPGIEKEWRARLYWVLGEAMGASVGSGGEWSHDPAAAAYKQRGSRAAAHQCPHAWGGKERFIDVRDDSYHGFNSSRGGGDRVQRGQGRQAWRACVPGRDTWRCWLPQSSAHVPALGRCVA